MHLAYIWIVLHLCAKNYRNWWKFDEVLTKTNLLSFFWDTVYNNNSNFAIELPESRLRRVNCARTRAYRFGHR